MEDKGLDEDFEKEIAGATEKFNEGVAEVEFPLSLVIAFKQSETQVLRGQSDELVLGMVTIPDDGTGRRSVEWAFVDGEKMKDDVDIKTKLTAWLSFSQTIAQFFPSTMPVRKSIEKAMEDVLNVLNQD